MPRPYSLDLRERVVRAFNNGEPHVMLRGLMGELAERQIVVSYGAIWNFLHREGLSFKKKHGRQRAGSS